MEEDEYNAKRNVFRTYLQEGGVLDHITSALVKMCNEQDAPTDALKYLKESLNGNHRENNTEAQLQEQNSQLKKKIKEGEATQGGLERRLRDLQKGTKNHEPREEREKATKPANKEAGAAEGSGEGRNERTGGGAKGGAQNKPRGNANGGDQKADN